MRPIINNQKIELICEKIRTNRKVHEEFDVHGVIHLDRKLPFICVYRCKNDEIDQYNSKLVKAEASYLIIPKETPLKFIQKLLYKVISILSKEFGPFLIIEIWSEQVEKKKSSNQYDLCPKISLVANTSGNLISTCQRLQDALSKITIQKNRAQITITYKQQTFSSENYPLISKSMLRELNCYPLGIAFSPIYIDQENHKLYPLIFKKFHYGFTQALKHAFFEFSRLSNVQRPPHYHSLGSHLTSKMIKDIDGSISLISSQIHFLIWVGPINTDEMWKKFKKNHFEKRPVFNYRPIPVDPSRLKEKLYQIPIDSISDPTLQNLFHGKRLELDRQLTMLYERNTRNFYLSSMQLYGKMDQKIIRLAKQILNTFSSKSSGDILRGKYTAQNFASSARSELNKIEKKYNQKISFDVQISAEVSGLIVDKNTLFIGEDIRVPSNRLEALIQHEIGTHAVTYLNGLKQPFQLFMHGTPGYDELQEGLAVLAEFLVGQLTSGRIRLLAARVLAAAAIEDGANFLDIFEMLTKKYGFTPKTSFYVTMRVTRSGGFTKDGIYLRGFVSLINFIKTHEDLTNLYLGKYSLGHYSIVTELVYRNILQKPVFMPTFFERPMVQKKIEQIRKYKSVIKLLEENING